MAAATRVRGVDGRDRIALGEATRAAQPRVAYIGRGGLGGALVTATLEDAGFEVTELESPDGAATPNATNAACVVELPLPAGRDPDEVMTRAARTSGVVIVLGVERPSDWASDDVLFVSRPCSPRFLAAVVALAVQRRIAA